MNPIIKILTHPPILPRLNKLIIILKLCKIIAIITDHFQPLKNPVIKKIDSVKNGIEIKRIYHVDLNPYPKVKPKTKYIPINTLTMFNYAQAVPCQGLFTSCFSN